MIDTMWLVVFWGGVIILAEILKWAAAAQLLLLSPWLKGVLGGH